MSFRVPKHYSVGNLGRSLSNRPLQSTPVSVVVQLPTMWKPKGTFWTSMTAMAQVSEPLRLHEACLAASLASLIMFFPTSAGEKLGDWRQPPVPAGNMHVLDIMAVLDASGACSPAGSLAKYSLKCQPPRLLVRVIGQNAPRCCTPQKPGGDRADCSSILNPDFTLPTVTAGLLSGTLAAVIFQFEGWHWAQQ